MHKLQILLVGWSNNHVPQGGHRSFSFDETRAPNQDLSVALWVVRRAVL